MQAALNRTLFSSSQSQSGPQEWCSFSVAARPSSSMSAAASVSSGSAVAAAAAAEVPGVGDAAEVAADLFFPCNDLCNDCNRTVTELTLSYFWPATGAGAGIGAFVCWQRRQQPCRRCARPACRRRWSGRRRRRRSGFTRGRLGPRPGLGPGLLLLLILPPGRASVSVRRLGPLVLL